MNKLDDLIAPVELIEPVGNDFEYLTVQGGMKCNTGFVCATGEMTDA